MELSQKPKVSYTDNSMEFGRACEVLSWNHRTSTPHRSETNGVAERAVRRVKVSSIATVRTRWMVVVRLYGMPLLSAKKSKTSWQKEKRHTKDDLENHSKGQWYLLDQWLNIIRLHRKIRREIIILARKYYHESFWAMNWSREEFGKGVFWKQTWNIWNRWMHQKFILEESTRKNYWYQKKEMNSFSQ